LVQTQKNGYIVGFKRSAQKKGQKLKRFRGLGGEKEKGKLVKELSCDLSEVLEAKHLRRSSWRQGGCGAG
jgi:hypothetical protein